MTQTFNEIHNTYQEILLLINETIDIGLSIASIVFFSFWFIWWWIVALLLWESVFLSILGPFAYVWLLGFIIILVPWILWYILRFIFLQIIVKKHYKIISKLEEEYYELDTIKQIPYILHSAKKLYSILQKDGIFFYICIYFWLYLEKRWIMYAKRNKHYTKWVNTILAWEAWITIERKKQLLLSLIEKIKIMETEVVKNILKDLRSDLSIRLAEQSRLIQLAKSELEKRLHWSPEITDVSEIQKVRLDRQIEQFEELQKVLVKA